MVIVGENLTDPKGMSTSIIYAGPEFVTTLTPSLSISDTSTLILQKNQFAQLFWNGVFLDHFDRPGTYLFNQDSTPLATASGAWSDKFLGQIVVVRTDVSPSFSVFTSQPMTIPGNPEHQARFHAFFKVSLKDTNLFLSRFKMPNGDLTEEMMLGQLRTLIQSCAYQIVKGTPSSHEDFADQLLPTVAKELEQYGLLLRMLWVENYQLSLATELADVDSKTSPLPLPPPQSHCPRCDDPWTAPFCDSCGYESKAA